MAASIKVENLSKIYRLGQIGTGTISKDMERWFRMKIMGQPDPFLKIGQTNDRTQKGMGDVVYSLKDINFEIEQGDAVGIIGRNGAGKSTLLKVLSRVTSPTTGKVHTKGRVASLLEVGTGFHPELTGRENIYLNGAILGMRKREITRKLDEIIDFSGVERYIDTPVKRYSSGMYVRLAFAVAAHLESEILIVDEVLAVGDAEFQKKCLGKMGEVSKGDGRTVLFVSHNMSSVNNLCQKGLLMVNGQLLENGEMNTIVRQYQLLNQGLVKHPTDFQREGLGLFRVEKIVLSSREHSNIYNFKLGDKLTIQLNIRKFTDLKFDKIRIIIGIYNLAEEGYLRFDSQISNSDISISENETTVICEVIEHLNIKPDQYKLNVLLLHNDQKIDYLVGVSPFSIINLDYFESGKDISNPELSKVFLKHKWIVEN